MGTFIKKPKKVNFKRMNSKDNPYAFINTSDMAPAIIIIFIINIKISAPLASTLSYRRAKLLINRPLLSLLYYNSDQIRDILSDIMFDMIY